jgi:hypothetical protein
MNTSVRFGGYAVRREFRLGLMFHGSVPPKDAPPRPRTLLRGEGTSPYRRYKQYTLCWRHVSPSYQGACLQPYDYNDSDGAVFITRRAKHKGDKQIINRLYRRAFKQQLALGLEAPSEFHVPNDVHNVNNTW